MKAQDCPKFGPLQGVKVVNLTMAIAGPFACSLLADLGAEVIGVESPRGRDTSRPTNQALQGWGTQMERRNTRSLCMNVKDGAGRAWFFELLKQADILVDGFRGGQMAKWGMTDEALWEVNPKLTIAHISGFGQTGDPAYVSRASFDGIGQAYGCFMEMNGYPDRLPVLAFPQVSDYYAGFMASIGALAGYINAQRTGKGDSVDVAQYEAMLRCEGFYALNYLNTGALPVREGSHSTSSAGYGTYICQDGVPIYTLILGPGVVYGVTSAFYMYLAAPVLINAWFKKSAGLAISITAATLSILAAVASPIGQELINQFGWQTARAALSIVTTVLSVVLTVAFVRKSPTVMGLLPFGAGEQDDAANQSAAPEPDEGATVAQAIKSPGLYLLILVACIFVMCAAFFQQIPAFAAHGALGASAGAMAVSIVMVGGVVFKLVLGALNDKIGVKYTGIIAASCGAIGILLAYIAGENVALFYAGMVVFGGGYAGLTVIAPMLARAAFGSLNYSQIYSWVSTGIFIATAVSFLVYGMIYDTTGSFDLCFILVIGMYALAVVLVPVTLAVSQKAWKRSGK